MHLSLRLSLALLRRAIHFTSHAHMHPYAVPRCSCTGIIPPPPPPVVSPSRGGEGASWWRARMAGRERYRRSISAFASVLLFCQPALRHGARPRGKRKNDHFQSFSPTQQGESDDDDGAAVPVLLYCIASVPPASALGCRRCDVACARRRSGGTASRSLMARIPDPPQPICE